MANCEKEKITNEREKSSKGRNETGGHTFSPELQKTKEARGKLDIDRERERERGREKREFGVNERWRAPPVSESGAHA